RLDAPAPVELFWPTPQPMVLEGPGGATQRLERPGTVALKPGVWKASLGPGAMDWIAVLGATATARRWPPVPAPPPGFVWVPPGEFLVGSDDDDGLRRFFLRAAPLHLVATRGYFIGRTEVTLGEYIAFLDSLPKAEADRRAPSAPGSNGLLLLRSEKRWRLELTASEHKYEGAPGGTLRYEARGTKAFDWHTLPLAGIARVDLEAYAQWLASTGRVPRARLCTNAEWERAARGADGRRYPTGATLPARATNIDKSYDRRPDCFGPDPVGSHPDGKSPFGLDDMAGNVWEMTLDEDGSSSIRGGGWYESELSAMSANREPLEPNLRDPLVG